MSAASVGTHLRPASTRWATVQKAATALGRRVADVATATQARLWSVRQAILGVAGLGCIDASAFEVNTGIGLLTTGVSLLVLGWVGEDED